MLFVSLLKVKYMLAVVTVHNTYASVFRNKSMMNVPNFCLNLELVKYEVSTQPSAISLKNKRVSN